MSKLSEQDIKWLQGHGFTLNDMQHYVITLGGSQLAYVDIYYSDVRQQVACRIISEITITAQYEKTAEKAFNAAYFRYRICYTAAGRYMKSLEQVITKDLQDDARGVK